MIKRPVTAWAITAFVIAFIVVCSFRSVILNENKYDCERDYNLTFRINNIEEKNSMYYLYSGWGFRKMLFTVSKETAKADTLKTGNIISVNCNYKEWNRARNKGNFDERNYYNSLGYAYKFKINSIDVTSDSYNIFLEWLRTVKNSLIMSFENSGADNEALLKAIALGYKDDIESDVKNLFKASGIAHIFAISGLHISFVGMGIFRTLRKRLGGILSASFSIFLIICYGLMCGISASTLRAIIMLITRIIGIEIGRKNDMLSSACLAMLLMLLENPFYVTNSGFLLSFSAICSVAIIPSVINSFLAVENKRVFKEEEKKLSLKPELQLLRNALISGSVISLSTLPFIISFNYEFPLTGVFVNTMVLWSLSYILSFALSGSIIFLINKALGIILINISSFLLSAVRLICELSSKFPLFNMVVGSIEPGRLIVYYFLLILFVFLISKSINKYKTIMVNIILRIGILLIISVVLISLLCIKLPDNNMHITFIDVDQGKCIYIKSPNGNNYLIDSGSTTVDRVYKYRVESALKYKGVSEIDYFILTHPDKDHISGLFEMLDGDEWAIKVNKVLSYEFTGNSNYEELINSCMKNNVETGQLYNGMEIRDEELTLSCIHPDKKNEADKNINDRSAVIMLDCYGFKAVFTGDIGCDEEIALINGNLVEDIDLLDVAHHGSRYSSSEDFLNICRPEIAVISAGVNNMYGHPHKDTLSRLVNIGCDIFNTQIEGEIDITVSKSGKSYVETMFEK